MNEFISYYHRLIMSTNQPSTYWCHIRYTNRCSSTTIYCTSTKIYKYLPTIISTDFELTTDHFVFECSAADPALVNIVSRSVKTAENRCTADV